MQPYLVHYQTEYQKSASSLPGNHIAWLQNSREQALTTLLNQGFPTQRHEDWKYTSTDYLFRQNFNCTPTADSNAYQTLLAQIPLLNTTHYRLIFINGLFQIHLSHLPANLAQGIVLQNISQSLTTHASLLEANLSFNHLKNPQAFELLNLCLFRDGVHIAIPDNTKLSEPIHVIFLTTQEKIAIHAHNLITLAPHSEATVLEHYIGFDKIHYFSNSLTQIKLSSNSQLRYCKLQQDGSQSFHQETTIVEQQSNSQFIVDALTLNGMWLRSNTHVALSGTGASCQLQGIYLGKDQQHIDHHTLIDHLQPACKSREWYKGIAGDQSHVVFNGKICVAKDAQHSDAQLTNKNILLSNTAEIDTKPELEIYADDVKCTHGATVGQLADEAIFYLKSRGLSESDARNLLIHAFMAEVIDAITPSWLHDYCHHMLKTLTGGAQLGE